MLRDQDHVGCDYGSGNKKLCVLKWRKGGKSLFQVGSKEQERTGIET